MPIILAVCLSLSFVFFNSNFSAEAAPGTPQNFKLAITTSLTQYGITWTFANPVTYGQFINGDYWVIDPDGGVKITNISPGDTLHTDGIRHKNGSMINPSPGVQGYDSFIFFTNNNQYDATKNVGIGITTETPLILTANKSLVSTISNTYPDTGDHLSYVKTAAVLTCLASAPPAGSFRPGVSSPVKTLHNINSINYSLLKSLSYTGTKPDIAAYANKFKMVWLDNTGGWQSRELHPTDTGIDNYYYSITFSDAALMLHLDYTIDQKRDLLLGYIQLGIDLYSYIENGGIGWQPDGGHASGRKWPILFAGIMLDYAPLKNIGQKSGDYLYSNGHGPGNAPSDYIYFGEDGQTFYVTQNDVDRTSNTTWVDDSARVWGRRVSFDISTNTFTIATPPKGTVIGPWSPDTRNRTAEDVVRCHPYTAEMIGLPEWGIRHSIEPYRDDASWGANYRSIGTAPFGWTGAMMSALIMNAKTLWNNNAFFDYTDRYLAVVRGRPNPFGYENIPEEGPLPYYYFPGFAGAVYDAHRTQY